MTVFDTRWRFVNSTQFRLFVYVSILKFSCLFTNINCLFTNLNYLFTISAINTNVGNDNCWCSESKNESKSCENLQGNLYKNRTKFFMSGTDWIQINEFCKKVGWNFLFDFNVLKRNRKGNWRYVYLI